MSCNELEMGVGIKFSHAEVPEKEKLRSGEVKSKTNFLGLGE